VKFLALTMLGGVTGLCVSVLLGIIPIGLTGAGERAQVTGAILIQGFVVGAVAANVLFIGK
jgi:hypothetical protein